MLEHSQCTTSAEPQMVEIELRILTSEDGPQVVRAWTFPDHAAGLALHRRHRDEKQWRISHIGSGQCLDIVFQTVTEATQFLAWMAQGAPIPPGTQRLDVDWRLPIAQLRRLHPGLERSVKARIKRWKDRQRQRERRRCERDTRSLVAGGVARIASALLLAIGLGACGNEATLRERCETRMAWARDWEDSLRVSQVFDNFERGTACAEVLRPAWNPLAGGDTTLIPRRNRR